MTTCAYCTLNPPIANSHVVPAFVVRHIKENNPEKFILNSWEFRKLQDGLKGPYLCKACDNVVFSGWENHFKKAVSDPIQTGKTAAWTDEDSLRFVLSVAFRYMIHFLETSPIEANRERNRHFRDLTREALADLTVLDSKLFIYPYQYRPIMSGCGFAPGVNHFLQLGFQCLSLASEDSLPQALAMFLPGMIILITDGSLAGTADCDLLNPESLALAKPADFSNANLTMPEFLRVQINRAVGDTQANQKGMGLWGEIDYGADKLAHPDRQLYTSQARDSELQAWQRKNCRNTEGKERASEEGK